jgi:hypothetical protein
MCQQCGFQPSCNVGSSPSGSILSLLKRLLFGIIIASQLQTSNAKATSGSEIISNAKTWLNPPVPYSKTAYHNGYRQDCSGYVSMAWELGTSETTSTLAQYACFFLDSHHSKKKNHFIFYVSGFLRRSPRQI